MSIRSAICVALAIAAALSCGKGASPVPKDATQLVPSTRPLSSSEDSKRATEEGRGPARSHLLGTISRKAIGPFASRAHDSGIVAWIAAAERGGGGELIVVPFGIDGAPLRGPRVAATVPREATSLILRATGRNRGGWLVAWSALLDRGESLTLLELAQDGTVRGTPIDVQRTGDHIVWADLLPTTRGALCIWAEETVAGSANILVSPIDSDGKPSETPIRVARGVARWGAVRANDGVGLALVTHAKGVAAGTLSWLPLDEEGHARGAPIAIDRDPTVSGDVDVVPYQGGSLLLWTDRTGEDAQVSLAAVDAMGVVQGPVRAMNTVGGASVVKVASGDAGISLLWEAGHSRFRATRTLHMATVSTAGGLAAQSVASLDVLTQAPLDLIATGDGFALLATTVAECHNGGSSCSAGVPIVVRYDARLTAVQTEPLVVGPSHTPAALAWGLRCASERCVALAAAGTTPTPVFAIDLPRRLSPFDPPAGPPPTPPGAPQATGLVTLASGQAYTDLAATRVGDATLVATLTNGTDVPRARDRGRGATIAVRPFDDNGRPLDTSTTLTTRAVPVGRVAIAGSMEPAMQAAAAWVARDAGEARDAGVYVALLDGHGHRTKEARLTNTKGDAGSVAIAWAGDGWLVAWVDARNGNGEVYAAKIDRNLNRLAPDRRITHAPGDAADVSLAASGETAWLAWSDPRESPREGIGDVYVTTLSTRDAKRSGGEVRVVATAAHSRSPEVVAVGGEALVAWIEDTPTGVEGASAAMLAHIDAHGHVLGLPAAVRLAGQGRPTAIVLASSATGAQAVIARSAYDGVMLDAFKLSTGDVQGPPWTVVDLEAPPSFDAALALAGGALFYDDTGTRPEDHRVRRAAISW